MTTSAETTTRPEVPIPPGLPAMRRLFRLGLRHEPTLLVFAVAVTIAYAIPDALIALWLKLLADGLGTDQTGLAAAAMLGLAASTSLTWVLGVGAERMTRRFRDKITIALERHVAGLQAGIGTITHQERPDYLDRLAVLRHETYVLDHMYMTVLGAIGWLVRVVITLALLASVHPALVGLALFAAPMLWVSTVRPVKEREVEERYVSRRRLADHLYRIANTAAAGKELRVTGIGPDVVRRRRQEWDTWFRPIAAARMISAGWLAGAWLIFGAGFVLAVWWVLSRQGGSAGDALLIVAAGQRLSSYMAATMSEIAFIRGTWMEGSRRLAWLEDYAEASASEGTEGAPHELQRGITFDRVDFAYPGAGQPTLQNLNLTIPAGAVVAIVGENGAGKSTLVKLIAQYYRPDVGTIMIDDQPLATLRSDNWRERLTGAFQDFARFEFTARTSIGIGDLTHRDDDDAVRAALRTAQVGDLEHQLVHGLDTQLGATWPDGVDLSFGQWQKIALARAFMRTRPLVLLLDEPTAALDAETEHALFAGYANAAQGLANGGITILVSHRFSTVRMADLIIVLAGNTIAESGTHDQLLAANGTYADLYRLQAAAYRT